MEKKHDVGAKLVRKTEVDITMVEGTDDRSMGRKKQNIESGLQCPHGNKAEVKKKETIPMDGAGVKVLWIERW